MYKPERVSILPGFMEGRPLLTCLHFSVTCWLFGSCHSSLDPHEKKIPKYIIGYTYLFSKPSICWFGGRVEMLLA